MKPRPTGNELFDIFWEAYPYRINGTGAMEKKRKGPALKWFETHNPSEVQVCDMVRWINADKANRRASESSNDFYSAPPDAIVWLNQKRWMDEIGVEVTKTTRREAHRSKAVYSNNVKSLIEQWEGVIKEWPAGKLKAHKGFMHAAKSYPEFAKWALEQRPDLKGAKADEVPTNIPLGDKISPTRQVVSCKKPDTTADLPPPKTGNDRLVEQFIKDYDLF